MVGAWKAAAELARERTEATASFILINSIEYRRLYREDGSTASRSSEGNKKGSSVDCLSLLRIFRAWNGTVETGDLFGWVFNLVSIFLLPLWLFEAICACGNSQSRG